MEQGLLFAQIAPDPVSGGAGWVGAGLFGLVLGWLLLKHLPDKDKMILSIVESRDKIMAEQRQQHSETIRTLGTSITQAVEKVTSHCRDELEAIAERIGCNPEQMEEALARALARQLKGGGAPP